MKTYWYCKKIAQSYFNNVAAQNLSVPSRRPRLHRCSGRPGRCWPAILKTTCDVAHRPHCRRVGHWFPPSHGYFSFLIALRLCWVYVKSAAACCAKAFSFLWGMYRRGFLWARLEPELEKSSLRRGRGKRDNAGVKWGVGLRVKPRFNILKGTPNNHAPRLSGRGHHILSPDFGRGRTTLSKEVETSQS